MAIQLAKINAQLVERRFQTFQIDRTGLDCGLDGPQRTGPDTLGAGLD